MRVKAAKRAVEAILARAWPLSQKRRIVVLCYHSIHPTAQSASATPALFEEHLRWLHQHCGVVSLREALEVTEGQVLDRPVVAITFDDGLRDNHTYALPLLESYGTTATVFVTTGLVDAEPTVLRAIGKRYPGIAEEALGMSWTQVREMHGAGIEIGAHTRTHPSLSRVSEAEAAEEIRVSKWTIEDQLQGPVRSFAYPFGKPRIHFTARTMELVSEHGMDIAGAILYRGVRPTDSRFSVPRFAVTKDSLQLLSAKIHGKLDILGAWQGRAPLRLARLTAHDPSRIAAPG
jgi:peptidoglycan/xylan/chitin deacetylase (PgdA/CDA1 family)